ncbi:MAG: CRTAC1 family protein [Phycisphaerales bacterium]|nr:CRTAC1 family protein [Phycisphaerales bacterium]
MSATLASARAMVLLVSPGVAGDPPPIRFEDVTASSGIDFTSTSGVDPSTQIVEVKGGGVALIDSDQDGDFDLFFPNGATLAGPNCGPGARLYENLGSMKFRDATAASGLDHHAWSFGSAVGDVDSDGFDDLYVACLGPDRFYRGLGDGRFVDATEQAGFGRDRDFSTSAALADFDGDGDLDLYVTNYLEFDPLHPVPVAHFRGIGVIGGPRGLVPQPDRLHRNDGGLFTDVSEVSGIRTATASFGLNALAADFTGDGRVDLFVGNDSMPNFLLENMGGLKFREIGQRAGCAATIDGASQASMGLALGDVNADRRPDVLVTVFSDDTNTLFASGKPGFFDDASSRYGVGVPSRSFCGWAAAFADLDHDADEDLFVVNGHVYPEATAERMNSEYRQPKLLMRRDGARFVTVADESQPWLSQPRRDRSAVFADLDHDGDIDAVVTGLNESVQVLANRHDAIDDWVEVSLDDLKTAGNRRGVGARIELTCDGRVQTRWVHGGGPFQSNQSSVAHFGIGAPAAEVDPPISITVTWPDGETTTETATRGRAMRIRRLPAAINSGG